MTFDGNVRVNKKVTFERIREHLLYHYKKNLVMELLYNSVLREIRGDCLPEVQRGCQDHKLKSSQRFQQQIQS